MVKDPYFEREVAPGVWRMGRYDGGAIGVNASVLISGGKAVIVDTMAAPRESRRLEKRVRSWGVEPIAVVNTHWHTDRTKGNWLFDCPIWGQKLGPRYLKHWWPKWVGAPGARSAGGRRMKVADHRFARRATLGLEGREVRLIHLPGHTADSIGGYFSDRRVLVAGDAVMDLPFVWFGDNQDDLRSLRNVHRPRPRTILQGQGPTCSYERVTTDIRYLESLGKAVRHARAAGVPRRTFVKTPMEEFLPPAWARELGDTWRRLHELNLWRVWFEAIERRTRRAAAR
jgi:cyclase